MYDIVTFGSAVVDVFADTGIAEKKGLICYTSGSKILLKNLRFDIGGGGTNTAVAFSRLGLKTGYVGKIGDDGDGKAILACLKKEGVSFLGKIDKGAVSGHSIILDSRQHERTVLAYKGINDHLNARDVKDFKTKWIYFSSMLGESYKTQKKIVEKFCGKGVKIAFNPSEYLIKQLDLTPILKHCEVLVLNKEEAELLAEKYHIKGNTLEAIHFIGPRIVVVTDKDKMIYAYDGKKKYSLKPHRVKVVERTGAGDAFASGFVAGLIAGYDIEKALKLGLEEGESVLRHFGAKNDLIKRKLRVG